MKIIISPAKKMNIDTDTYEICGFPKFLEYTKEIMKWVQSLDRGEMQKLWACNDQIADLNYERLRDMNLENGLTPAVISYEGIQYQYMAPGVFTQDAWEYLQEHLRILSGFYGCLKPMDGVVPYRLEMQAKAKVAGTKDLYAYWGDKLYQEVKDESRTILNLASKEYSKIIEKYLQPEDTFITCVFGEWKNGKIVQKATQAKMARGEMVRYMAEHQIENLEEIKKFDRMDFSFSEEHSTENEYVFIVNK